MSTDAETFEIKASQNSTGCGFSLLLLNSSRLTVTQHLVFGWYNINLSFSGCCKSAMLFVLAILTLPYIISLLLNLSDWQHQYTTLMLGSQLTVSLMDITACVSSQSELESQFFSIQLASAPSLSPASTLDTPPQLPLTQTTDTTYFRVSANSAHLLY